MSDSCRGVKCTSLQPCYDVGTLPIWHGKNCTFIFSWKMTRAEHRGLSSMWQQVAGTSSSAVFRQGRHTLLCLGLYLSLHHLASITGVVLEILSQPLLTWKWTGILGLQLLNTTPLSFWFPRDFLREGKQPVPAICISLSFPFFHPASLFIFFPPIFLSIQMRLEEDRLTRLC